MSKSPDASRFVEWLRASRAHEPTPLPTSLDTLKALIADAMAFADGRAERAGGGAESPLACRAGCHWCCHLPVQATVAETIIGLDYALTHYSPAALVSLRERARVAASRYPAYVSERSGETQSLPCVFLEGRECGIYPARPLTCRGWGSYDANACETAFRCGPDSVTVPINQRLRMVHAAAGDSLRRVFEDQGLEGHVYLGTVLHKMMENDSIDTFARNWLAGAITDPHLCQIEHRLSTGSHLTSHSMHTTYWA